MNSGTITIRDARLTVNGDFADNSGTLKIAKSNSSLSQVDITGTLTNTGTVLDDGSLKVKDSLNTSGTVSVGDSGLLSSKDVNMSGGTFDIAGTLDTDNFVQTGGTLTVESSGTATATNWDFEGGTSNISGLKLTETPPTGTMTVGSALNLQQGSSLVISGSLTLSSGGSVVIGTTGSTSPSNSLTVSQQLDIGDGGAITLNQSGDTLTTGSLLTTSGTLTMGGGTSLTDTGNFSNTGGLVISGCQNSVGPYTCGTSPFFKVDGTSTNSGDISLLPTTKEFCDNVPLASGCDNITIDQLKTVYNSGTLLDKIEDTVEFIGQLTPNFNPGDVAELLDPPNGSPPVSAGVDFNNVSGGVVKLAAGYEYLMGTGNFNNDAASSLTMSGGNDRVGFLREFANGGTVTLSGTGDAIVTPMFANTGTVFIGTGEAIAIKMLGSGENGTVNATSYSQSAGSTDVNGALFAPAVHISGGDLSGRGLIASLPDVFGGSPNATVVTVTDSGTIIPGELGAPGTLTIDGSLAMYGTLDIGIDGSGRGQFDVLDVTGAATFGTDSIFQFMFGDGFHGESGDTFQFFDASSFLNFNDVLKSFSSSKDCANLMSGLSCMLSMNGTGDGLLLTLNDTSAHGVPEPGSLGMMGLGLLMLGGGLGLRKRRGA